jgi:ABC-type lipoprotein export system ATPase subunit
MRLELDNVSKAYGATQVLRGASFSLESGRTAAIVGPSGCGKSTLLNVAGGLDRPDSGQARVDGLDLSRLNEPEAAHLRNRKIGFIFQAHHLLPQCTVLENVLVPTLAESGAAKCEEFRDRAAELLDKVGLRDKLEVFPSHLSGGERQRAAVARALIMRPGLLLADEPTGSLDEESAGRLADMLAQLSEREGLTIVMVTHAPYLAARMQSVLRLERGKLLPQ